MFVHEQEIVQSNVEFIMSRLSICIGEVFGTVKW